MKEDAEGLVGVVVEEVEGFGGSGVGDAVGGHAVGVDGVGFAESRASPVATNTTTSRTATNCQISPNPPGGPGRN